HFPRVVKLEYKSSEPSKVKENLYFVGKGVTYDTGGADIKAGGIMRGMSRDKCGAATVTGFMATLAELKPKHVNVTAFLSLVRNSVGSNSYVSDEVIYSRAGLRVLVGNTDAEGRMVMTDPLCECKERVLEDRKNGINIPSRFFTVATLTGHAIIASGGYGICLDNGPARKANISPRIQAGGHILGDPFEISTLRREDYSLVMPGSAAEDVVQANDKASSQTPRGHQYPMAFMAIASGVNNYGLDKKKEEQIAYTHVDIAGSAEELYGSKFSLPEVTGNPVPAFAATFLL
ncbi:Cytosol aminopeptidase, catalytic domain, partial [Dissophora globulifera]